MGTWTAYGNQYWPAKYLIDAEGQVRYVHFGEGEYDETEAAIRTLLREKGDSELGGDASKVKGEEVNPAVRTPETYLGAAPRRGLVRPADPARRRRASATHRATCAPNEFAYSGRLEDHRGGRPRREAPTRRSAPTSAPRRSSSSSDHPADPRDVEVLLDGEPVPDDLAGEDVKNGVATIGPQRLYRLVDLPKAGSHELELRFEPGIYGYAVTFGWPPLADFEHSGEDQLARSAPGYRRPRGSRCRALGPRCRPVAGPGSCGTGGVPRPPWHVLGDHSRLEECAHGPASCMLAEGLPRRDRGRRPTPRPRATRRRSPGRGGVEWTRSPGRDHLRVGVVL